MRRLIRCILIPAGAGVIVTGCNTFDEPTWEQENAFLQTRTPRYGAGGTQSPSSGTPNPYGNPVPQSQYSQNQDGTIFLPTNPQPTNPQASPGGYQGPQPQGTPGAPTGPGVGTTNPGVTNPSTGLGGSGGTTPPSNPSPPPSSGGGAPPFGVPVPGKTGYVYSPFDDQKRYVDVTDIPSGTEVRCPYTQKIFRVP